MGRFTRAIRGFFGRFLSGVEQRNPQILLENAVQDELENLKKLQVAAARTMAYEKMLANDAVAKQKTLAVKERQARELASRGQREAAIEVVQQKQEAQASLTDIESRLEDARKNSQELEQAFRDQERRYNNVVRERAALMEEHQRSRALRTANEARSNISLSDSSRDLEKARQSIRQASYEAEAIGELGTSETERQIAAAEIDIKRLDAERELEMMEVQMGLREPEPIEAAPTEETAKLRPRRPRRNRVDSRKNLSRRLMVRLAPFATFAGLGTFAALEASYVLAGLLGIGAFVTGRRLLDRRENARKELLSRVRHNRGELGRVAREDRIAASQMKRLVALQDGLLESWELLPEECRPLLDEDIFTIVGEVEGAARLARRRAALRRHLESVDRDSIHGRIKELQKDLTRLEPGSPMRASVRERAPGAPRGTRRLPRCARRHQHDQRPARERRELAG